MKRVTALICLIFISIFSSSKIYSVESTVGAGIENSRLLFGEYVYKNHFTAKLNVSVYSEKLGYQYARGTIGYKTAINDFCLSGSYFFGSAFNRSYYNTGAKLNAEGRFFRRLIIDASIAPWFDSGYNYITCWEAKLGCIITNNIDFKLGYSTIPEFRMSEKRILCGFDFHVKHLYVTPYLSIGTSAQEGGKNIRVIFGFGYLF